MSLSVSIREGYKHVPGTNSPAYFASLISDEEAKLVAEPTSKVPHWGRSLPFQHILDKSGEVHQGQTHCFVGSRVTRKEALLL
jgi:hypothetical protein